MSRKPLVLALAALLVGLSAAPADALTARVKRRVLDDFALFAGSSCGATDTYTVQAGRTGRIVGYRGNLGQTLYDDFDSEVAHITDLTTHYANGRPSMTWTAQGCDPVLPDEPWETEYLTLGFSYVYRVTVRLGRNELRSDARVTLSAARIGWDAGYARRLRCRKISRYRGRCRFWFIVGDGEIDGSFVSRKLVRRRPFPRPDRVWIRNRGRARIVDTYCLSTGGTRCVSYRRIHFG